MPEQELSLKEKKKYARILYLNSGKTQKDIAGEVEVSEQTMCDWVLEGKWKELKTTLTITQEEQLKSLYYQLQLLNEQNTFYLQDDDPKTNPDYDSVRKLTKSIEGLQKEPGMGEKYKTMMEFLNFIQREDLEFAQQVNNYADAFLKQLLSKF